MRIVALEEHFAAPDLVARIDPDAIAARGWPSSGGNAKLQALQRKLADVSADRLADMDAAGVTMQVLSASGPGADIEPARGAPDLARDFNDRLAEIVRGRPDRFAGFAQLPLTTPEASADELERAIRELGFKGALINGTTDGMFLDDPRFEPLLTRAEALGVPLYIHPGIPPLSVRDAYYVGLPAAAGYLLSTAGFGWHAETALHIIRLVLSGTLDRHPELKLIIGHMGEGLATMLDRLDDIFGDFAGKQLGRGVAQTIRDQTWVTTSGFFSLPPFVAALLAFGADRILFSVDYPFSSNATGTGFLDRLPVSPADKEKIAHGNADTLLGLQAAEPDRRRDPTGSAVIVGAEVRRDGSS